MNPEYIRDHIRESKIFGKIFGIKAKIKFGKVLIQNISEKIHEENWSGPDYSNSGLVVSNYSNFQTKNRDEI